MIWQSKKWFYSPLPVTAYRLEIISASSARDLKYSRVARLSCSVFKTINCKYAARCCKFGPIIYSYYVGMHRGYFYTMSMVLAYPSCTAFSRLVFCMYVILLLEHDHFCNNLSVPGDPGCSWFSIHPLSFLCSNW